MNIIKSILPFIASVAIANAATLLNENFNAYSDGALNSQGSWTAISGVNVASGGLSYTNGDITINGGSKHATWSSITNVNPANEASANIGWATGQSGDVWFSLTMNVAATSIANRFWFYVSDDPALNTGSSGVLGQINSNSDAFASGYRVGSSQRVSTVGNFSLADHIDETIFLVGRYSKDGSGGSGYNRMEVWVNPDSTTLGTGIVAEGASFSGATGGIDSFAITALGGSSVVSWDNVLVGTTQADVVDVYAIPESSTYALIASLAAMGMGLLYRRRK